MKKEIIDKINSFFGYNCIGQVTLKIVQEQIKPRQSQFPKIKNFAKINDNQLKNSLNNFLKACNEKSKKFYLQNTLFYFNYIFT